MYCILSIPSHRARQEDRRQIQLPPETHLIVQIQALEARHRLGELRQLGDRLHRGALAAVEEPRFGLPLLELATPHAEDVGPRLKAALRLWIVAVQHVGHQRPLRQLERLHVVNDERLLGKTRGRGCW